MVLFPLTLNCDTVYLLTVNGSSKNFDYCEQLQEGEQMFNEEYLSLLNIVCLCLFLVFHD